MLRQTVLRPHDVAVALQLAIEPGLSFPSLATRLGMSVGESHNAVKRLEKSRLILAGRGVNGPQLLEFMVAGVPHAFPAELGPESMGVPTSHSGPPLAGRFPSAAPVVWPSARGTRRGQSLAPLYAKAPDLAATNPTLYGLLTLVDALRIGRARERNAARDLLREALSLNRPEEN